MLFSNSHNHSTFSDSIYTPEEIASKAKQLGYKALILTDHDTVNGTYFMQKAARKEGLLSLIGCEFTTVEFGFEDGFHLLGFDFNRDTSEIRYYLDRGAKKHRLRTELLLKWAQEKGRLTGITWEDVCEAHPYHDFLGNNHVFNVMVHRGLLRQEDYFSFFDPDFKWNPVTEEKIRAEVQMHEPTTCDVIEAIRKAGGVPVLAHPHNQMQFIPAFLEAGLMGIEANHPDLTDEEIVQYHKLTDQYGLYRTGGTDHHGVLGGYADRDPPLACDLERNNHSEEDFMTLYERKLG